jgi:CHAP domain
MGSDGDEVRGAHYRIRNWSRLNFALFIFGLSLFGTGIGIMSANADVSRVSATTTTTFVPATTTTPTTTQITTTTTVDITRPKPTVVHRRAEIGTALSIARQTTTTTTSTEAPKTPLEVAQSQVGKTGPYAEGGFWCAKFASFAAEKAEVPQFEQSDSPARLYAVAKEQGRLTNTPQPGYLVFIDLTGQNNANDYISHVGIVEWVDGDVIHTIEGNADDSGVVTRQQRYIGDGFVIDFAPFSA